MVGWIALSDGLIDRNGKPLGTDFSNVYAAGTLTWQGRPAEAYEPALQHAAEKAVSAAARCRSTAGIIRRSSLRSPFSWPPFPMPGAFRSGWRRALRPIWRSIRAILPRPETLLIAAAFPAVFVNIGHGQNGFLTAALLGGALHWLDRRPWLAGVLIGCLAYKPQFGVLIPVALLAGGRWSTIGAAAATVAALVAISFVTLGGGVWHAFADSMTFTQTVVLEQGGTGWEKIQSVFSAVRMWGAGVHARLCRADRAGADARRKPRLAVAAAMPRSNSRPRRWRPPACSRRPMCSTTTSWCSRSRSRSSRATDLTRGFRDYEISLLAAAWIVPLLSRGIAGVTGIPLGLLVLLALYVFTLRRAVLDRDGTSTAAAHGIAQA